MKISTSKNDFKFYFAVKIHLTTRKLWYNDFIKTKKSQSVKWIYLFVNVYPKTVLIEPPSFAQTASKRRRNCFIALRIWGRLRHAEFIWGIFKRLQQWTFFFLTKQWTDDLLIDIRGVICLMELWVPGSSSCEQRSSSKIDAFSSVVAATDRPLPLRRYVDSVSLIFWLSYELPCGNIQNSDASSRFCMRSNLFH